MLILKPIRGNWYIVSSDYPLGAWFGFWDEDMARMALQWMADERFDCDGILERLYAGKLTDDDRRAVKRMNSALRHSTRLKSKKQNEYQRVYRQLKMDGKPS